MPNPKVAPPANGLLLSLKYENAKAAITVMVISEKNAIVAHFFKVSTNISSGVTQK